MNLKETEPAIIWKRVHCQRITSKNIRPWWVDTWARDTVRWYLSEDTLFWQLLIDHNIDVQSALSWAPKVARECESKHWYACGAEGRSVGHVITKFSGMGRFNYPWRSASALRARSPANNFSPNWWWVVVLFDEAAKRWTKYHYSPPTLTWIIVLVYTNTVR